MSKKMLSTILSAMLILSLIAVMPVMAAVDEVGTIYLRDDFENYTVGTTYDGGAYFTDKDGKCTLYGGSVIGGEVVSMEGYDGETTTAMKAYLVEAGNSSKGSNRLNFAIPSTSALPQSGIAVTELKLFFPEENRVSSFTSNTLRAGDSGTSLAYGRHVNEGGDTVHSPVGYYIRGEWTKIKFVHNVDTNEVITYINDVMTTYHKWDGIITRDAETNKVTGGVYPGDYLARFSGKGNYLIVDDINFYYAPAATAPVATYPANNEAGVVFTANPSVTFNVPLMNVVNTLSEHADAVLPENAVVTNDNVTVEVIECTDESKLGEIEATVTLSNNNKTLNIEPAEEFPSNAKIRVTVSGLRDDLDRDVAETSFEFRTIEKVELTGAPVFKKENLLSKENNTISAIQNGYISCEYTLTNAENASAVDVLFFAVLKVDGVVERFQFKPATVGEDGGTTTFKGGFNVKDAANSSIEVYVWDSMQNMISFVPMVSFDANGLTTAQ